MGHIGYNSLTSLLLSFLSLWIHYTYNYLALETTLQQFYERLAVYCFIAFEYPFKGYQTGYYIQEAFYASSQ
jgi:hypothetical protein